VARLAIQTIDMLKWTNISDASKTATISVIIDELQPKLLHCDDIQIRLAEAHDMTISEANEILASGGNTLPHLIGLNEDAEAYLNTGKQYLRDLTLLVNALFDASLAREASVFWDAKSAIEPPAAAWGRQAYGAEFGDWIADQASWIGELCKKRNAIEHPGGKSGSVTFANFQRLQGNVFLPPSWQRAGPGIQNIQTDLQGDLRVFTESLLLFSEELVAYAAKLRPIFPQIEIQEIGEADRNAAAPVRLKVGIKKEFWPPH
jgi:hypothetical protein